MRKTQKLESCAVSLTMTSTAAAWGNNWYFAGGRPLERHGGTWKCDEEPTWKFEDPNSNDSFGQVVRWRDST